MSNNERNSVTPAIEISVVRDIRHPLPAMGGARAP
jgi:hypothetical protein